VNRNFQTHQTELLNIYVNVSECEQMALFSGINFNDFIDCEQISIENILLLKSGYTGERIWRNFELLEGKEDISKLIFDNVRNYGNFCFVDYLNNDSLNQLSEEQIAELLYLAHMFKPLKSPFFEGLQNKFAYLSHDDGWYCKLYFKESDIPISILINKLQKNIRMTLHNDEYTLSEDLIAAIKKLSVKGLLISSAFSMQHGNECMVQLYEVGEVENMDVLFNTFEQNKLPASFEIQITI